MKITDKDYKVVHESGPFVIREWVGANGGKLQYDVYLNERFIGFRDTLASAITLIGVERDKATQQ